MLTTSSKVIRWLRWKNLPELSEVRRVVREILDEIERWRSAGKRVAIARVVDIEGSGPRDPGAAMAVSEDAEVAGSVSGGCVEGAVVSEALGILGGDGQPRLVTFGYSDDEAFSVGLTCGGTIHLFIEPLEW
jgi:xanthine dehydrogenase accessory factor